MKLYTITMIDNRYLTRVKDWHSSLICVCTSVEEAKKNIEANDLDISEGATHEYAVIAEIESDVPYGLSDFSFEEIWYQWRGTWKDGQYHPCEKPDKFRNIGFGI